MKIFIFNLDTIFTEADGLDRLNRIPCSRSTINPYVFEQGSLQDCYTLNKKRMAPIFKAILEKGNKIGFATPSTSTKKEHIKIFFAMEYGLSLRDDFICFPRNRINTYLKEAAKLFQLQHANVIVIDDNEYHINEASKDGFTVIHVDSNEHCNTHGTVYVKKLEEVLQKDNSCEANNPVAAQTQMELKLAPPMKIFMFDIDETLLCWGRGRVKHLNDIPRSKSRVNPYREFVMVDDDTDDTYDEDTDDTDDEDTDDKCYTLNKGNLKPIIEEIRKQGHVMGFITAGTLRKKHIKEFFQYEYTLDLGDNFIHYFEIKDKTHYLKEIAIKYKLSHEKIILIDDNHKHIAPAREAGFTTILVDSLHGCGTHGTEYIRMLKMELGLQVDKQHETYHEEKKPVDVQTEPAPLVEISELMLQTGVVRGADFGMKIFMFDIDHTLLCRENELGCLNSVLHVESCWNPYEDSHDNNGQSCFTLNKERMKSILQKILKLGYKIGCITAGKAKKDEMMTFFSYEYEIYECDLGDFIYFNRTTDRNTLQNKAAILENIAKQHNLPHASICLVDDNPTHIDSAMKAGFTTVHVDNGLKYPTNGTEYVRILDEMLKSFENQSKKLNEEKLPSQSIITIQHEEMTSPKVVELNIHPEQSVKVSSKHRFFKAAKNTTVNLFTCCLPCFKR